MNHDKNKGRAVESYLSQKIVIRTSIIHGSGMFAAANIVKGEIVFIKGGHILTAREKSSSKTIDNYLPIDDDFFIGPKNEDEGHRIKLFVNHSCEPNCGLRGEITFVAMRGIRKGDELTCDYAMIDNENYEFACKCGAACCRTRVTGYDWRITDLQQKYSNYFARYLLDKIDPAVHR